MKPRTLTRLRSVASSAASHTRHDTPIPPRALTRAHHHHHQPSLPLTTSSQPRAQLSSAPPPRLRSSPPRRLFSRTRPSSISPYALFPLTFPLGPPPSSPFTPSLSALRREFLALQAATHPDRASPAEKHLAEARSAALNDAYRLLRDPLKRAQWLLKEQAGVDVEDEAGKLGGGAGGSGGGEEGMLLMEVMEAREAVEEAESEDALEPLREENEERIERSVEVLEEAFGKGEWERAARETVRLRYWRNIEESIKDWEEGRGGGVNHHD